MSLDNEFESRRRRVSVELHAIDKLIADANAALLKSSSSVQNLSNSTPIVKTEDRRTNARNFVVGGEKFDTMRRRVSTDIRSVEDAIEKANEHMHSRAMTAAARDGNVLSPDPLHGQEGPPILRRSENAAGKSLVSFSQCALLVAVRSPSSTHSPLVKRSISRRIWWRHPVSEKRARAGLD